MENEKGRGGRRKGERRDGRIFQGFFQAEIPLRKVETQSIPAPKTFGAILSGFWGFFTVPSGETPPGGTFPRLEIKIESSSGEILSD